MEHEPALNLRGRTIWHTAENACLNLLAKDKKLAALVVEKWPLCVKVKDWVYQRPSGDIPTMVEMHVAVQLVANMEGGLVAVVGAKFGHTPSPDKEAEANQAKLDDLPAPFYATFNRSQRVGMLDCDGTFGWEEPVLAETSDGEIMIPPMAVALEVGYMPATKMLYGINRERGPGIARWSYGYDAIVAFIPMNCIRRI